MNRDFITMNLKPNQETGNVLFLILIAVALFAALSYAVTQSSRGNSDSGSGERSLINSASLTQYPQTIKTSVMRMIVRGIDDGSLEFNTPSIFDDCSNSGASCVFHPDGGNAAYANAPSEMMLNSSDPGTWVFNAENEIYYVGTSGSTPGTPTAQTADYIAFLPGITESLCSRVNEELGLPTTPPVETGIDVTTQMINTDGSAGGRTDICDGGCGGSIGEDQAVFNNQPFGCFELINASDNFVYYHAIVER